MSVQLQGLGSRGKAQNIQTNNAGAVTTGGTLAVTGGTPTQNYDEIRVNPAGNVTGMILAAGSAAKPEVTVFNESAFSVTFAAAGTSGVADGVSDVIAALTARKFRWNQATSLWYRVG